MENLKKRKLGSVERKIILLLGTGLALALTRRPDQYFHIAGSAMREWQKINRRGLHKAIKKLYQSQMIDYEENSNGTIMMTLASDGKKRFLEYNLDRIQIKTPAKWDGLWRIVIFDIPEHMKKARDALSLKMKQMGLKSLQKSVFVYPHECRDEIIFISEIFNVKPFVRYIIAKDIDADLHLKREFNLI